MYIQNAISNFFSKASEFNYDIVALFDYNAVATTNFVLFVLVVILSPFLIYKFVKTLHANRFINKVKTAQDIDEYDRAFIAMIDELALNNNTLFIKEIYKNAQILEDKYNQFVKLVPIKDKIIYVESLSQKFDQLTQTEQKIPHNIKEFFRSRAYDMIEIDLKLILKTYVTQCLFFQEDIEDTYAVIQYANKSSKNHDILEGLKNRFINADLTHHYTLVKFITLLDKNKADGIYDVAIKQLAKTFYSQKLIHTIVLETVYHSIHKAFVYDYIAELNNEQYVKYLYKLYFDKNGDIMLNLALINNDHIDNISHRSYITSIITTSWRNRELLEQIAKNKHIINIAGHEETRKTMARIDELKLHEMESENRKLALEAKELAQKALDRLNINEDVVLSS